MDPCFRRDDGEDGSCNLGCMTPCVYILASARNGTLYIGVTSNLPQWIWQHREGLLEGFTRRYGIKTLV